MFLLPIAFSRHLDDGAHVIYSEDISANINNIYES